MNKKTIGQDLADIGKDILSMNHKIEQGTLRRIDIVHALNDLRMILEHAVSDAALVYRYRQSENDNIYFPYGALPQHFSSTLGRSGLKRLKKDNPELLQLIEEQQPYNCGSNWVVDLCHLSNKPRHVGHHRTSLLPKTFHVAGLILMDETCTNVKIEGNIGRNGERFPDVYIKDKDKYEVHGPNPHLFQVFGSRLIFSDKNIEVVPFLTNCYIKIYEFVQDFYPLLKKEAILRI